MLSFIEKLLSIVLLVAFFRRAPASGAVLLGCEIPQQIATKLHSDRDALISGSTDFGNVIHNVPASVLYPSNDEDIRLLISSSYNCSTPFTIAAKGNGHSTNGQAMAENGVVVEMSVLEKTTRHTGVFISDDLSYADVGGQMTWTDVILQTTAKGVMPLSLVNYPDLTIGGTLSNAGIEGLNFHAGPQISHVLEMDVITGKGDKVTCSPTQHSSLYLSTLGGLGQFGIITRARIPLKHYHQNILLAVVSYVDFQQFQTDQDIIGTLTNGAAGHVVLHNTNPRVWQRYYPESSYPYVESLVKNYGLFYVIEIVVPYDPVDAELAENQLAVLMSMLSPIPELVHKQSLRHIDYLLRLVNLKSKPSKVFYAAYVPRSNIVEFNSGIFADIIVRSNLTMGSNFICPENRQKWNLNVSAVIPEEDSFYSVAIFNDCDTDEAASFLALNDEIISYCDRMGLKVKEYMPSYSTKEEWEEHFGEKWPTFVRSKEEFDPKHILAPGQRIFI